VNLKQWAEIQGIYYHTAYRCFHDEVLPVPAERMGPRTILVNPQGTEAQAPAGVVSMRGSPLTTRRQTSTGR